MADERRQSVSGHLHRNEDQTRHFLSCGTTGQLRADSKTDTLGVTGATWTFVALLLLLATQLFNPSLVLGDSTGEYSPTVATGDFTNAVNAFACGGSTATATGNNQTERYSVYGLSLPNTVPTPVVTGIQVRVRANDGSKSNRKLKVSLSWNGGTTFTEIFGAGIGLLQTRNFRSGAPLKDYLLGGSGALWGRTSWSASELSDANFRVKVAAKMPGGSGNNINLDCIPVTVFYVIPGLPDLSVAKTASPDPVGPTGNLTYTITYSNTGQSTATNTIVSDTTPANTTFVSASPAPTSAPPVGDTGTVTWNVGSVPVGGSGAVTLVVKVNASVGTQIVNDTYSIASDQNAATFGNPVSTTVANAVLTLSKSASPDPVMPAGTLTYTLTLHNAGSVAAANVLINEGYDGNAPFSSQSTSPAGCASFGGAPDNDQWTITSFAAGATCTITITTTVHSPLEDGVLLANEADAADDAGDTASAGAVSIVNQCAGQADDTACDDGNACTQTDTCQSESCVGTGATNCDDGNVCTDDTCDFTSGCVHTNNTAACDDSDACTTGDSCSGGACVSGGPTNCDDNNVCTDDSCNPSSGCVHTNNNDPCDDGNACTTADACSGGTCLGGPPLDCNDNNVCTDDSCDSGSGCVHTNNTALCDDGNACTTGDACSGGICVSGGPTDCDDGNACTTDSCAAPTGCTHTPQAGCCNLDTPDCDSTDQCRTNTRCVDHACVSDPVVCNDHNPCTDDSCNPASGCTFVPNNNSCDDGNACTTADACSGGTCVGGPAPNCNDGNVCTDDSCDAQTGCVHTNNTAACDDHDACTTGDACRGGTCVSGGPTGCDDGNACTTDSCTSPTGCTHTGVPGCCNLDTPDCDTTDQCRTNTRCVNHTCVSDPVVCNDHNPCTDDGCNPQSGCTFLANNLPCDDGTVCNGCEVCGGGTCNTGTPLNCNDGKVCTTDACDPVAACQHTDNTVPCDDNTVCNGHEVCGGGTCNPGTPLNCNDGNVCTSDTCGPASGCVHTNNTATCDDLDPCTSGDVCAAGSCAGTPDPTADPSNCLTATELTLNHFLCYSVSITRNTPKFSPFLGVNLLDQFGPLVMDVKKPVKLCAPADKNNEDPTAPDDPDHLMGYMIVPHKNAAKFVKQPNREVLNQFGTIFVDVKLPASLLVPSAKSLSASPPAPTSPAVDHFECYKVSKARQSAKFVPQLRVPVKDQFGQLTLDVTKPTQLCAPVDQDGGELGAETHVPHLMCYAVKVSKGHPKFMKKTPVFVNNQAFGALTVDVKKPQELCVPSLKNP